MSISELDKKERYVGKDRMLLDLLCDLASGHPVYPDNDYEKQLEFYKFEIFRDTISLEEVYDYAYSQKKATKFMYPAQPTQIRSKVYLISMLAEYTVLFNIYNSETYNEVADERNFEEKCLNSHSIPEEDQWAYQKQIKCLYGVYSETLNEDDYNSFCDIMFSFVDIFDELYRLVISACLGEKEAVKKDFFSAICEKYGIDNQSRVIFKLQLDAMAEVRVCMSDYVEYFESLKHAWNERFGCYPFGEEIKSYVNEHKRPFVIAYGNQMRSLRKEIQLFEMLACVNIKIALADGAKNIRDLDQMIRKQTYNLAYNLRPYFTDNKKKMIMYYHLKDADEAAYLELNDKMIPFKKDFLYLNELLMEEINYRNQNNVGSKAEKKFRKQTKDINEFELLLSEKDALIHDLKADLAYYENLEAQGFKSEVSQYDKAIKDLFLKLCDSKYGCVFSELYLISADKKKASVEEIKGLLQNMVFIFSSMGINPYNVGKIGKKIKFYEDEANLVYSVDEKKVKDGCNCGTMKFPGWTYKDDELVLPRIEIIKGEEEEEE